MDNYGDEEGEGGGDVMKLQVDENDALSLLSSCNMMPGDQIMFIGDTGMTYLYAFVDEILDAHRFRVRGVSLHPSPPDIQDVGNKAILEEIARGRDDFRLLGIRVADRERIAHINFAKRYEQGFSNRIPLEDVEGFDPELYRILYPDARNLTTEQAFLSVRRNWASDTVLSRISKADDIMHTRRSDNEFTLNADLNLNDALVWNGHVLTGVTNDYTTDYDALPMGSNTLITEYGIKRYIAFLQETEMDSKRLGAERLRIGYEDTHDAKTEWWDEDTAYDSNLVQPSNHVRQNVYIDASTFHVGKSDVNIDKNMTCTAGLGTEFIAYSRLGVGGGGGGGGVNLDTLFTEPTDEEKENGVVPPNVYVANAHVNDTLSVGGWKIRSEERDDDEVETLTIRRAATEAEGAEPDWKIEPKPDDSTGSVRMKVRGDIRASGTVLSVSDASVKDDVRPIENALDKVRGLRGCTYTRRRTDKDDDEKEKRSSFIGLIAQETRSVVPEAVFEDERSGQLSIAYGNLVGVLVEAIKELDDKVTRCMTPTMEKGEKNGEPCPSHEKERTGE